MVKTIKYLLLIITGLLIIALCSTIQKTPPSSVGEYHYSSFFKNNYTILTAIIFFIAGIFIGYYLHLNPWLSGICLVLIFYITAVIESIVYRGSHNLIPFEFIMYFVFALPSIIGAYAGHLFFKESVRRKKRFN